MELAEEYFEKHPEMVTFLGYLEDWGGICEYENCAKVNDGKSPPLYPNTLAWKFMNADGNKIHAKMPREKVVFFAVYVGLT